MSRPLEDYVEVKDRIAAFYEKYPEGSLRCKEIRTETIGEHNFLIYVAQAFRKPDDPAPAEGSAWEPVPGKTNFTRDSELMNAETSAWGRAIAALGFEVQLSVASQEEVRNRSGVDGGGDDLLSQTQSPAAAVGFVSEKQKAFWHRLLKQSGFDSTKNEEITRYAETIESDRISAAMDWLTDEDADKREKAAVALMKQSDEWKRTQSDVPYDESQ